VLSRLGDGSMGVVYQGRGDDGTLVAIKVINPDLAHDPVFLQRFLGEAEYDRQVRSRTSPGCSSRSPRGRALPGPNSLTA